ncbi:hypothetical protein MJO28_017007, partial [Puccinia striiformis f. sp. tritici]
SDGSELEWQVVQGKWVVQAKSIWTKSYEKERSVVYGLCQPMAQSDGSELEWQVVQGKWVVQAKSIWTKSYEKERSVVYGLCQPMAQ